jgi:NADPH:quinone reductase-like Zn-dependent oxidoreductase
MPNTALPRPISACRCRPACRSDQAAALPETLMTVWHNVFERAYAREGETILVHGVHQRYRFDGDHARQAVLTVIVTCGGPDKCKAALAIGADHAIDLKAADFVEEVARITAARACIVLDMVAGDYVARNLKCSW